MKKISMMIFILFLSSPCFGDEVRSHVDARGNVTYTNSGPTIQEQQQREVERKDRPQVQKKTVPTIPMPVMPDTSGMTVNRANSAIDLYNVEVEAYKAKASCEEYKSQAQRVVTTVPMPVRPKIDGMTVNRANSAIYQYSIEVKAYKASCGDYSANDSISAHEKIKRKGEAEEVNPNAQSNHGAIDQHGNFYAPAAGGIVDPRDGTFHQEAAGGYINTKTGEFMPAR